MKLTTTGIIMLLCLIFSCKNQSYKAYNKIFKPSSKGGHYGKSGPYKMSSQNGEIAIESIPFEYVNTISGDLCSGITKVYQVKNDSLIYTINRYFGLDNTFLSPNGNSIVYVNNFWRDTDYDSCSMSVLGIYKAGNLIKEYSYLDLLKTEPDDKSSWLYSGWKVNEVLYKNNRYSIDSLLYLIPRNTGTVITLNLNTGEVINEIDTTDYLNNLELIEYSPPKVEFITIEEAEYLPNLINGKSFRDELKTKLNVELISLDGRQEKNRYYFRFGIECKIDSLGQPFDIEVFSNEHVLIKTVNDIKKDIKTFIQEQTFVVDSIPYDLEFWNYEDGFYISQNPKTIASQDLERYRVKVCELDSLSGNYIPMDIIDAHKELDKILDDSSKVDIKNGATSHHGLGRWLRNNWGLWAGGRLNCFFAERELYHPDGISSLIILTYQMKLNNQQVNLDSLIQEHSKAEKEWIKN